MEYLYTPRYCYISPLCFTAQRRLEVHNPSKTKHTYLAAHYKRLAARRGKKRALIAVGHTVLSIASTLLTRRKPSQDLGAVYFDQRDQQRVERRLVQRLERLGYEVSLQPRALAS
jgi:transposase